MLEVGGDLLDVAHDPLGEPDHWLDTGGQHRIMPAAYSGPCRPDTRRVRVDRTEVFLEDVGGGNVRVQCGEFKQADNPIVVEIFASGGE